MVAPVLRPPHAHISLISRWRADVWIQAHVGPVHSMFMCRDGYATGGQDGAFRLWSPSFEPIRTIPLRETPVGYRLPYASPLLASNRDVDGWAVLLRVEPL